MNIIKALKPKKKSKIAGVNPDYANDCKVMEKQRNKK